MDLEYLTMTPRTNPSVMKQLDPVAAAIGISLIIGGTGSVFETGRAEEWSQIVQPRVSYHVKVETDDHPNVKHLPDSRSASEHLTNIREVFHPAISELAGIFGVSRQSIYQWMREKASPESDKLQRIRTLSHAADDFRNAGITCAPAMLKMKEFQGQSLMDLVTKDQLLPWHIQSLITVAQEMDADHKRATSLASKAKPSEAWRSELSIPGSFE